MVKSSDANPPRRKQRKKRADEADLNWWAIGAFIVAVIAGVVYLRKTIPVDEYQSWMKKEGALFYVSEATGFGVLFRSLVWGDTVNTLVTSGKVAKQSVISFVPNTLTITFKNAGLMALRRELAEKHALNKSENVLFKNSRLATAVVAVMERRQNSTRRYTWLKSLPKSFKYSRTLTADQKAVLRGTMADAQIEAHDRLIAEMLSLRLDSFKREPISIDEAVWALGLSLHFGLDDGEVIVPGLLDGLERTWDDNPCARVVPNVAPTGKLPGYALAPTHDMAAGEPVLLCTGRMPNAHLIVQYGIAYPENIQGPMLQQLQIPVGQVQEAQAAWEQSGCEEEHIFGLSLSRFNKSSGRVLDEQNIRCNSLFWMGDTSMALEAIQAGYFDSWPRNDTVADVRWAMSEGMFYEALQQTCNASLARLGVGQDEAALNRLRAESPHDPALIVRDGEVELNFMCQRWTGERHAALSELMTVLQGEGPQVEILSTNSDSDSAEHNDASSTDSEQELLSKL